MRNPKNALLVAASALVMVALLAVPASASASVWLRKGEPLKEHVEFPLTGGELIEVSGAAMICNNTATMSTEGGSTAQITAFNISAESCFGLSGKLAECQATSATAKGLPWGLAVGASTLAAKEVGFEYVLNEACAIHKIAFTFPEVTVVPEDPSAIRLFHFGESVKAKVDGEEPTLTDTVSLQMSEENSGVYGIG